MQANCKKGIAMEAVSGTLYGSMGVLGVLLMKNGFDFIDITMLMFLSLLIFNLVKILVVDRSLFKIRLKYLIIIVIQGAVLINANRLLYFYAVTLLPAGICSILIFCMVFPLMYVSSLFFKERLSAIKIILSLIALLGVVLVINVFGGGSTYGIKGIYVMLLCIMSAVLNNLANRYYVDTKMNISTITFYFSLAGFLALSVAARSPISFVAKLVQNAVSIHVDFQILLFCIAAIGAIMLLMYGLNFVSTTHMGICQSLDPITATILGALIFADAFTALQIFGIVIIVGSVIGLSFVRD